jgi:hypothetical protein
MLLVFFYYQVGDYVYEDKVGLSEERSRYLSKGLYQVSYAKSSI